MCEVISHLYLLNMSNMQDPCYTQWVDLREKFQSISSQSVQLSMAFNGHFRESTNMEDNRQFNWTGQQGIDNGVYFLWKLWIYVAISGTDLLEVPTILNINGHFKNRFIGGSYYILFGLCFRPILYKFQGISPENIVKNMVLLYLHVLDPEIPIGLIDGSGQWPRVRVPLPYKWLRIYGLW